MPVSRLPISSLLLYRVSIMEAFQLISLKVSDALKMPEQQAALRSY